MYYFLEVETAQKGNRFTEKPKSRVLYNMQLLIDH